MHICIQEAETSVYIDIVSPSLHVFGVWPPQGSPALLFVCTGVQRLRQTFSKFCRWSLVSHSRSAEAFPRTPRHSATLLTRPTMLNRSTAVLIPWMSHQSRRAGMGEGAAPAAAAAARSASQISSRPSAWRRAGSPEQHR